MYDDEGYRREVAAEVHRLRVQCEARQVIAAEDRPPVRAPAVLTLRERLARPRPTLKWRIEGWQPVGSRVMLAAQYKAGKTTVAANLDRALVDGDLFLNVAPVTAIDGILVHLDFEMGAHQLDDWFADQKIRNDDRIVVIPLRGAASAFDILDPKLRAQWAGKLAQLDCQYLIVDCLRPVLDALGLDEHREAGRFLTALDAFMAEAGIPESTVVQHMGHVGERSRGDSRLRDWPDVEWRLVREDDTASAPRYLSAYGRDVEAAESLLSFDPATRRLSLAGGTRKDAKARAALVDVLDLLAKAPGLSGRQIEEQLMESTHHVRNAIRAAVKAGIRDRSIDTARGDRRSTRHFCAPVRESAPIESAHTESECASALIDGAHTAHTDEPGSVRHPAHSMHARRLDDELGLREGIASAQ